MAATPTTEDLPMRALTRHNNVSTFSVASEQSGISGFNEEFRFKTVGLRGNLNAVRPSYLHGLPDHLIPERPGGSTEMDPGIGDANAG